MAPSDDENHALQSAIDESFRARNSTLATQFGEPESTNASDPSEMPRRMNIEDRIKDMTLQAAIELPVVRDSHGDTWVYIDPPPRQPEQDELDHQRHTKHYEQPILVKKETLTKYTSFFEERTLFGPTAQFRIVRRRKLADKLRDSPNVKYVVDLTPPAEGDDAVYLTQELCCSEGVRLWYQASDIWRVSKILVGGKEEYTSVRRHSSASGSTSFENSSLSTISASIPMPLEYTPVRHRSAIERVIAALMGMDPKLDSAPKVWTTYAVANYFGITNSPVTDYIIRWLRAYPNSFFLEVCPEVSHRMADGLRSQDLARDTFAILVGEEALDSLFRARLPNGNHQRTVYGRKKEDLPEEIYTRVEYASKAFQERINNDFENFVGFGMQWVEDLPAVRNLSSHSHPDLQHIIQSLKALLKDYVRGTIYKLLCVNYDYVPPADFHHPGGDELIRRWSRGVVWRSLSANERILSRTFWNALLSFDLFEGSTNLDIQKGWGLDWDSVESITEDEIKLGCGTCHMIKIEEINSLVRRGNRILTDHGRQQGFELPDRTRTKQEMNFQGRNAVSFSPYTPSDDLDRAQINSDDFSALGPTPTKPIDIPQFSSRLAEQIFPSDNISKPDSRTVSQGARANWPFGASRQGAGIHEARDDEGHVLSWGSDPAVSNDQDTTYSRSERLAHPGFSSWAPQNEEAEDTMDASLPTQQQESDGRSTPPSSRQPQEGPVWQSTAPKSPKKTIPRPQQARTAFFDLQEFFLQARVSIEAFARGKLEFADHYGREEPHEIGITNTLVCLEETEWKYLPLWAGGYDDETGGVFNETVPIADLGFSTPGPEVHTGVTPANSTRASSEFEMIASHHSDSDTDTIHTSMANNRGFSDTNRHKHVYAAGSMGTTSSDDFDMVTLPDQDADEENARKQTEAQEKIEAAEDQAARDALRTEKGKAKMVDENYADLFNGCEDDEDADFMDDEAEDEDMIMV